MSLKGKEKAVDLDVHLSSEEEEESDSSSVSSLDSDSSSDSSIDEELEALLGKARLAAAAKQAAQELGSEGDIIRLDSEPSAPPIRRLDPGPVPEPYFQTGKRDDLPSGLRDPAVQKAEDALANVHIPAPPVRPPELTKSGKPLTKKERSKLKHQTAGPGWFDFPAAKEEDLPRLHREVEALRLRNHLDPKRFYRKEEGEGKGIKGLPKYIGIGTVIPSQTAFGGASSDNLSRANRKRTIVEELVDDAEAKRYAKRKFEDLQSTRGAKGRNTRHARNGARKGTW